MWQRFGFTAKISNEEIMPSLNLKFLLNSLRINHIRRKAAQELALLERYSEAYHGQIGYQIEALKDNSATAVRSYLTNRKLTDEAFGAIYEIMFKVQLLQQQINVETFLDLILSSEENILKERESSKRSVETK